MTENMSNMNGAFSFLLGDTKQTILSENVFARLQSFGRGVARLYFVNEEGNEIDVPSDFWIRDITIPSSVIDVDRSPNTCYFTLLWTNSYKFSFDGICSKFINQQQWAILSHHKWEKV
jgi:hypothetical protein